MLKFNETKELQRVIKADLDSQNYKGEPGFESNLYYHLAGGNVPTFEVDTKYDNYKTRLDAFVREFVKADVHVLELFGPGYATNSEIHKRVKKSVGLVKLERAKHEEALARYPRRNLEFIDCDVSNLRELRNSIKDEPNFNLIIGDPIGVIHGNRGKISPEKYYAGTYLYLSTIYNKLEIGGVFRFPIMQYNQLGEFDSQFKMTPAREYRAKIFELISEQYSHYDIEFKVVGECIQLKKGQDAPTKLPKIEIEEILAIHKFAPKFRQSWSN